MRIVGCAIAAASATFLLLRAGSSVAPFVGAGILVAPHAFAAAPDSGATEIEPAFESANTAFAEGRYDEAVAGFSAMVARHGESPALLFNLGNASFRAGRAGEAVLAYERALALSPHNAAVAANLRQVRAAANLQTVDPTTAERVARAFTVGTWAWIGSLCLFLACGALATSRLIRDRLSVRATAARALRMTTALAALGLGVAAGSAWVSLRALDRAVVVGDGLALRVAPYPSATTSSPIAAGEIVEPERQHDDSVLVTTADGRSGWLPAEQVKRIGAPVSD